VQRQSIAAGKRYIDPRLLEPSEPPEACKFVWDAFWSINTSRGGTGYGPAPIPCTEILAWSTLYRQPLEHWEIEALRTMDRVYLQEVQKKLTEDK
jgi:hypothetical protein